jgi:hypothetical protein
MIEEYYQTGSIIYGVIERGPIAKVTLIGKELLTITGLCVITLMYIVTDSLTIW